MPLGKYSIIPCSVISNFLNLTLHTWKTAQITVSTSQELKCLSSVYHIIDCSVCLPHCLFIGQVNHSFGIAFALTVYINFPS